MEWEERLPVNAAGAIPRAHRFLAVESTSDVEQPSPFAGRRSVGALRSVRILERALQPCIRAPIDDRRCSEGARGRDHDSVRPLRRRHRGDLRSSLRPAWCPRRPPQEGRAPVSLEPVRHRAARSFGVDLERDRARGNAGRHPFLRARVGTLENVPVRRCLKVCCRSRWAVPSVLMTSSPSRREGERDLALTAPTLSAKPSKDRSKDPRDKGSRRSTEGEAARGRGAQTSTSPSTARGKPHAGTRKGSGRRRDATAGSWVVALAGTREHATQA